jgi:hypothetical protein
VGDELSSIPGLVFTETGKGVEASSGASTRVFVKAGILALLGNDNPFGDRDSRVGSGSSSDTTAGSCDGDVALLPKGLDGMLSVGVGV